MKTLLLSLFALLASHVARAQTAHPAEFLRPEDIGAIKYVLEAQADAGQVVVLRREMFDDGKLLVRYDSISNQRNEKQVMEVLLLDLAALRGQNASGYMLKSPGATANVDFARLASLTCHFKPAKLTFVFRNAEGREPAERKYEFTVLVRPYDEVKRERPNLPEDTDGSGSWTFAASDDFHEK